MPILPIGDGDLLWRGRKVGVQIVLFKGLSFYSYIGIDLPLVSESRGGTVVVDDRKAVSGGAA